MFTQWMKVAAIAVGCAIGCDGASFVTVSDGSFSDDGQPFHFAGTNNYYLAYKSNTMIDDALQDASSMGLKVGSSSRRHDGFS
jgi:mannan endo-1,4-beta-mannosidase